MKKILISLGVLLLGSSLCLAQTTTVTATVVDSDSTVWANAIYTFTFMPGVNQSNPASYTYNGSPLSSTYTSVTGTANGSGVISATIYQNTLLSPVPSSYNLQVCPNASTACATYNFTTSTGSVDVSTGVNAVIVAPRFRAVSGAYGYNDTEATTQLVPGSTYWNVTSSVNRCYSGSSWGVCSTGGSSTTVQAGTNVTITQGSPCTGTCTVNASGGSIAWEKKGIVIAGASVSTGVIEEPTVFPVATANILTNIPVGAQVLGMFYTYGWTSPAAQLNYAESLDGVNWTGNSTSIAGHAHSCMATISGTTYILASAQPGGGGIDIYSFISGTATLVKSNIVTTSGATWKSGQLGNCGFWKDLNGSYYLLYDGYNSGTGWAEGLATCTAPSGSMSCTDYGSNPVFTPFTSGGVMGDPKSIRQLSASSYVVWLHGTATGVSTVLPTDGYFGTATSPSGPWTISTTSTLYRTEPIEGVNTTTGQLADQDTVDFNGACFNFYTAFPNGNTGVNGGAALAIASLPCNQVALATQTVARPASGIGLSSYGAPSRSLSGSISFSNGPWTGVTTLVLTPGTWLLNANIQWVTSGSTTLLYGTTCISPTNTICGGSPPIDATNNQVFGTSGTVDPSGYAFSGAVGPWVVTVPVTATSATYYLDGQVGFSTGAVSGTGVLNAVRIY